MSEEYRFQQNIIAVIWDFDKTLSAQYMQAPIFEKFGIDEGKFWQETNKLVDEYEKAGVKVNPELTYLNHLLTYTKCGITRGLNNKIFRELGAKIKFFDGIPGFSKRRIHLLKPNDSKGMAFQSSTML